MRADEDIIAHATAAQHHTAQGCALICLCFRPPDVVATTGMSTRYGDTHRSGGAMKATSTKNAV